MHRSKSNTMKTISYFLLILKEIFNLTHKSADRKAGWLFGAPGTLQS